MVSKRFSMGRGSSLMSKAVIASSAAAALLLAIPSAHASLVYEPFNYPSLANEASMNGVTTNATGLKGNYSAAGKGTYAVTYDSSGLALGYLKVQGGSVVEAGGQPDISAQLSITSPVSGSTLYGSYLINISAQGSTPGTNVAALVFGPKNANDTSANINIGAEEYGQNNGLIQAGGAWKPGTGTALRSGTTYLELFQISGVNATSGSVIASEWTLSASQFAHFQGNLTATALDAAATGTAADDVTQEAIVKDVNPGGKYPTIDSSTYLSLYSFDMTNQFDEIRLSQTSLADAAPVPEPASLGLFAVGGLGLLLLKRRKMA